MSDGSKIEWTDATWNPVTGCSVVSPGCANCYAMRLAGGRLKHHPSRIDLTAPSKAGPVWTGKVRLNTGWLDQPLRWRRPRRIFVCAHGDLFHEAVPDAWIDRVFAVMALCAQRGEDGHVFQVLTKRIERAQRYLDAVKVRVSAINRVACHDRAQPWYRAAYENERAGVNVNLDPLRRLGRPPKWPLPNVWLGVSAEDQARADERVPALLATPAAVRFLSAEPLLGPVDLTRLCVDGDGEANALEPVRWEAALADWRDTTPDWEDEFLDWYDLPRLPDAGPMHPKLDWVIAGGESGAGARPMHPHWARSLRDQCAAAGVPFFFKQWGEWVPTMQLGSSWINTSPQPRDPMRITTRFQGRLSGPEGALFGGRSLETKSLDRGELVVRVGKAAAGATLDGRAHREMPA